MLAETFTLFEHKGRIQWKAKLLDGGVECWAKAIHWHLKRPGIAIHQSAKGAILREVLVHEAFHLAFPNVIEEYSERIGLEVICQTPEYEFSRNIRRVILNLCPWMRAEYVTQFAEEVGRIAALPSVKERLERTN